MRKKWKYSKPVESEKLKLKNECSQFSGKLWAGIQNQNPHDFIFYSHCLANISVEAETLKPCRFFCWCSENPASKFVCAKKTCNAAGMAGDF